MGSRATRCGDPGTTDIAQGDSAWNRCSLMVAFGEVAHPFGCSVAFRTQPTAARGTPKFDPAAREGIFLGYCMLPRGRWRGDYLVADKEDFEPLVRGLWRVVVRIQRTKRVWRDPDVAPSCPFRAWELQRKQSLGGSACAG